MFPNKEILYVARNENNSVSGGVFGVTYLSALEVETLWVHAVSYTHLDVYKRQILLGIV